MSVCLCRIGDPANRQDAIYDLYAVSNHMGGLGGGHYTAYAKNLNDGQWYLFDDAFVEAVRDAERQVKGSSAYVLFYARRRPLAEVKSAPNASPPPLSVGQTEVAAAAAASEALHVGERSSDPSQRR